MGSKWAIINLLTTRWKKNLHLKHVFMIFSQNEGWTCGSFFPRFLQRECVGEPCRSQFTLIMTSSCFNHRSPFMRLERFSCLFFARLLCMRLERVLCLFLSQCSPFNGARAFFMSFFSSHCLYWARAFIAAYFCSSLAFYEARAVLMYVILKQACCRSDMNTPNNINAAAVIRQKSPRASSLRTSVPIKISQV